MELTKKYLAFNFFLLILFFPVFSIKAQVIITGNVVDIENNTPISTASVVLNEYGTNKVISYTTTDNKGNFKLDAPLKRNIYSITFRHLSFRTKEQSIIVNQKSSKSIILSISLVSKTQALEEVVIKSSLPIIVKKDTIIYNIKHWTKENNQTLEEVIGKIEGFKISRNGEIEVQGHQVRKVIIDGKEVFDVGASVFTKSLDPNKVKSIEVRFDEKNSKLKESLLDTEKYVVLDIKLKDNFKQSIFGKVRQTTGYQSEINLGGYVNLFSLKDKAKIHLFAEADDFGKQTISLKNIKHIGEEALQKIFKLPADFKSLTEKENYQEELYGFNNYKKNEKRIVGFTSRFELNKKLNLFFGSYNSLDNIGKSRFYEQTVSNNPTNSFIEGNNLKEIISKNKLEIKYDTRITKIVLNTNLVYANSNFKQENLISNEFYQLKSSKLNLKNYNNFKFETKINNKIGFEVKSSYAVVNGTSNDIFDHNNPCYSFELMDNSGNTVFNLEQNNKTKKYNFISSIMLQLESEIGVINLGNTYRNRKLTYEISSKNSLTGDTLQYFTMPNSIYKIDNYKPFLNHRFDMGAISISNSLEYSILNYQTIENSIKNKQKLNYGLAIKYANNGFNSSLKYNNRLSDFPLNKLIAGKSLVNFQTINTPATSITPQEEEVFEFSVFKDFKESKVNIVLATLIGRSNTLDLYSSSINSPFIYMQNNQLGSKYVAISTALTKYFKNGTSVILEPEFLTNKSQNINSNSAYYSITDRYFFGVKIKNNKKNRRYNYYLYSKYSYFDFSNTLTNFKSKQEMFSFTFNNNYELIKSNLFFNLNTRNLSFFGGKKGNFTNVSLYLSGKIKRLNWALAVENILNDQDFMRQSITPIYFMSENNTVFGRFIKLSIEYKFF